MAKHARHTLDTYCHEFQVGQLGFMSSRRTTTSQPRAKIKGFPLFVRDKIDNFSRMFFLDEPREFFHITKPGAFSVTGDDMMNINDWVAFELDDNSAYVSILNLVVNIDYFLIP